MQAVGVDLGYGVTKVAGGTGRHSFASAWTPYSGGAEAWGIGTADQPLTVDGRTVMVGDRAASRPGAHRPFGDGRMADADALPLLAAALWRSGVRGDVVLGSGTPLGRFARERAGAKAALEGRVLTLGDGQHETTVRIARLVLRPQGVGAALYLEAAGLLRTGGDGYVVVVDVGTRTTDVLTLEATDHAPVLPLCFSLEAGAATAAEAVAQTAQPTTGHLPPADVTLAALRRPVSWGGQTIGGPQADAALNDLATGIRDELRRRFGPDGQRVAAVALVGGGGILLADRLAGTLPGATVPIDPQDALFANAEGFRWAAALAR